VIAKTGMLLEPVIAPGLPDDVGVVSITFDLNRPMSAAMLRCVSEAERSRAARFRKAEDRIRFLCCRVALRAKLGTLLGVPPEAVPIALSGQGRPELVVPAGRMPLDFNLSHSGERGLIVWSSQRRVGADIERRDAGSSWRTIGGLVLGREDRNRLARLSDGQKSVLFYDIWSAKEAVLKAHGSGIACDLTAFSVRAGRIVAHTKTEAVPSRLLAYRTRSLDVANDYAACVAWSDEPELHQGPRCCRNREGKEDAGRVHATLRDREGLG
jgi:4'-phosphopantetheinyl transferase